MKLSQDDQDLLRWSGELEGDAPEQVRDELDELSRSVRRFPQHAAPVGALSAALARYEQGRSSPPRSTIRLTLYSAAAAIVVFGLASLLLSDPAQPDRTVKPSPAKAKRSASAFSVDLFPKSETPNLKRIRDARARILKLRERKKPKFTPSESQVLPRNPALS